MGGSTSNWVAASEGDVPENAFVGGHDNGVTLNIARRKIENNVVVGKVHSVYELSYFPEIAGSKEMDFVDYEVLVV